RAAGLAVRGKTTGGSMRAQLRSAANSGARFAAIVGDNEARDGVVQLKPLATDEEQRSLSVEGVLEVVRWGRAVVD
ncbi:MAG: His/Gly/Thr/Pro-type tRNA ligase C-terminal domain-containing protein, partial [Chloroflexi bacterium]|nr:His/Gly/Thr/Pro-type tRNA ligase C-terminal domain-containing protein [Chloroflexota bacterium]